MYKDVFVWICPVTPTVVLLSDWFVFPGAGMDGRGGALSWRDTAEEDGGSRTGGACWDRVPRRGALRLGWRSGVGGVVWRCEPVWSRA